MKKISVNHKLITGLFRGGGSGAKGENTSADDDVGCAVDDTSRRQWLNTLLYNATLRGFHVQGAVFDVRLCRATERESI